MHNAVVIKENRKHDPHFVQNLQRLHCLFMPKAEGRKSKAEGFDAEVFSAEGLLNLPEGVGLRIPYFL